MNLSLCAYGQCPVLTWAQATWVLGRLRFLIARDELLSLLAARR